MEETSKLTAVGSSTAQESLSGEGQQFGADHNSRHLQDMVIVAIPGQHSRKPHLGRLLAPHLPPLPQRLEVRLTSSSSGEQLWILTFYITCERKSQ